MSARSTYQRHMEVLSKWGLILPSNGVDRQLVFSLYLMPFQWNLLEHSSPFGIPVSIS